jgi:hypothetical protein
MPSNNAKITKDTREEILSWYVAGQGGIAQTIAHRHGLAEDYPYKLARSRGLVPRTAKRWGNLRESA